MYVCFLSSLKLHNLALKMATPLAESSFEEQRVVIRILSAEGVKPNKIYRGMSTRYASSCINKANV